MSIIIPLSGIVESDPAEVGGKAYALGTLARRGIRVPQALCVTREAYESYVRSTGLMERISLEAELQQAIERKELQVAYQPIIGLGDGKLVGFEALVRWRHPQRGMILPTEFIPMAEETGMIILIDRWVMREACRQTQAWQKSFPHSPPLSINVNISGKQVTQTDFVETVKRILDETGLPPASLHLEITENAIMENFDLTSDVLERVRGLGVCLLYTSPSPRDRTRTRMPSSA